MNRYSQWILPKKAQPEKFKPTEKFQRQYNELSQPSSRFAHYKHFATSTLTLHKHIIITLMLMKHFRIHYRHDRWSFNSYILARTPSYPTTVYHQIRDQCTDTTLLQPVFTVTKIYSSNVLYSNLFLFQDHTLHLLVMSL